MISFIRKEGRGIWKLVSGTVFFLIFLWLENSPLSDSFKFTLPGRSVIIPFYQWLLAFIYIIFLKYLMSEPWPRALSKVTILTFLLDIYPNMLDIQKQVWLGTRLSHIYVLYINAFVQLVTLLFIFWAANIIINLFLKNRERTLFFGDIIFFPVLLLSAYGAIFYYRSAHIKEVIFLAISFVFFLFILAKGRLASKIGYFIKVIFKALAQKRRLLLFIFVLALIMRLTFFFNLWRIEHNNYPSASDDGITYDEYGLKGVSDHMVFIRESPHYFMVFYSVLLTLIYKIFGHNYIAVGIIQSIIGALLACLTFMFAHRITGNTLVSFLAGLVVSMDSALIHLTTTMNTEVLYIPFIVLVMFFLLFYRESKKSLVAIIFLVLSAFVLGLGSIVRVMGIVLIIFILPWILIWGRRYERYGFLMRLRDGVIFVIVTFMAISPITYINYLHTKRFVLVYENSALWAACSDAFGEKVVPSNKMLIELGMKDPIKDFSGSVKTVLARPKEILIAYGQIIPKRLRNLYLWYNFGFFDPIYLLNSARSPNKYAPNLEFYGILLLFASLFAFIFSKIKTYLKTLTLLVIIFYTLFHGIFFISIGPRYGAPMKPFLYILTSFCLYKALALLVYCLSDKRRGV